MYDSVLVATDGGDAARRAAERGLGLARRFGADVRALSVVDDATGGAIDRRRAEDATAAVAERGAELGVEVAIAVESGSPATVVAERAAEWGVDLATAGASTATGLARLRGGGSLGDLLGGSVPEAVLDRGVPTLTAGATAGPAGTGDDPEYGDVLLAIDEGDESSAAAGNAVALAGAYGATLHAVCAVDARLRVLQFDPGRACRRAVRSVAERATDADVAVETAVRSGVPAAEVLRYADETGCGLLVQPRGDGGALSRLGGFDRREVRRRARAPVLTVPE